MNNKFINHTISILSIFLLVFCHLIWRLLFTDTTKLINIFMLTFLAMIIFSPKKNYIYMAIISSLICELFYTSPFGLETLAIFISLMILNWMLMNIFTNRSLIIIFFFGLTTMLIYRFIFVSSLYVNSWLNINYQPNYSQYIYLFAQEALYTSLVLSVLYLFATLFFKKLRPEFFSGKSSNV